MTELERLVQQILARPEEDARRKAYADALPAGNPRADFIRNQLQRAAATRRRVRDAATLALGERVQQAITQHGDRWAQPLLPLTKRVRFSRGFVEHVDIDGPTLLRRFDDLLTMAPVLSVSILGAAPILPALAAMPQLGRLYALGLGDQKIGDAALLTLLASPHIRNLRWLKLDNNNLSERAVDALFASPHLPNLQYLSLSRNPAPDPIMQPAGQDWGSDAALDYDWTDFGRSLQAKYGAKPFASWLVDRHRFMAPLPEELIGGK